MKAIAYCLMLLGLAAASLANDTAPRVRIARYDGDRAAAISYTFDDGLRDQYTIGVPILNEFGFKGTFFVIPGVETETVEQAKAKENDARAWGSVTWTELAEMAKQGHEIGSHTWSHPNLPKVPPEELDAEFTKANEEIKKRLDVQPLTLAFPFNATNPKVKAAASKFYVACRTYQTATNGSTTADSLNKWADKLVTDQKWGVLMTHAVVHGFSAMSDPEVFRSHLKYVKSHENEIWVGTFADVARYEKERDDAKLTFTESGDRITCTLTGTLDPKVYTVPLTVVIAQPGAKSAKAERVGKELPARVEKDGILVQAAPDQDPFVVTWK